MRILPILICFVLLAQAAPLRAAGGRVDSLKAALAAHESDSARLRTLTELVVTLRDIAPVMAREYAEQRLAIAYGVASKTEIAKSFTLQGTLDRYRADYSNALKHYLKAIRLHTEARDSAALAALFGNVADIYRGLNNYGSAEANYRKAEKFRRALGQKKALSNTLTDLGSVMDATGRDEEALGAYTEALKIKRANGINQGLAELLSHLGAYYQVRGQVSEANKYFVEALQLKRNTEDRRSLANAYTQLARINQQLGYVDTSAYYYEEARKIYLSLNDVDANYKLLSRLSEAYEKAGRYKEALEYERLRNHIHDSLFSRELADEMAEVLTKYDVESRDNRNELLEAELKIQKAEKREREQAHQTELEHKKFINTLYIGGMVTAILLSGVLLWSNRRRKRINKLLRAQKDEIERTNSELVAKSEALIKQQQATEHANLLLEEKNQEVTDSIMYAQQIQRAMLPNTEQMKDAFRDSFVFYRPRDIVSGDFYWFTESNGCTVWAVGDCTGHGVPGAMMTIMGMDMLNQVVLSNGTVRPDRVLSKLDELLHLNINRHNTDVLTRDGMDLAVCCLLPDRETLLYAGAKLSLLKVKDGDVERIKSSRFSIGHDNRKTEKVFGLNELQVDPDAFYYLFSDGFRDQLGGDKRRVFGRRRFFELLKDISGSSVNKQQETLAQSFNTWKNGHPQTDDIIVFGFKV